MVPFESLGILFAFYSNCGRLVFSRFHTIHKRDGQTPGQTDRACRNTAKSRCSAIKKSRQCSVCKVTDLSVIGLSLLANS